MRDSDVQAGWDGVIRCEHCGRPVPKINSSVVEVNLLSGVTGIGNSPGVSGLTWWYWSLAARAS